MAEALLTLEPIKRNYITIDGENYEIYAPDELSIVECQEITHAGAKIGELQIKHTAKANKQLTELIDDVARRAFVSIPDEVFDDLSGFQRMQIVSVFTGLLLGRATGLAGAAAQAVKESVGQRPSSGSNATLAGLPTGGGVKHRPGS